MSASDKAVLSIDTPRITIETVTPQDAARMLGTMKGNRNLRARVVQRYAREMIAGKWLLNGEAIKIARDGRLIDGQHRLNAVVLAKVNVKMCVVRGVDAAAMITLDTGVGRTFHDVGTIAGRSYTQTAGPIIRWWFKYQTGSPSAGHVPTIQEMQAILDEPRSFTDLETCPDIALVACEPGGVFRGWMRGACRADANLLELSQHACRDLRAFACALCGGWWFADDSLSWRCQCCGMGHGNAHVAADLASPMPGFPDLYDLRPLGHHD